MAERPSDGRTAEQPSDLSLARYAPCGRPPQELLAATRHRADEGRLGSGAYGAVFRGELRGGTQVAVKFLGAEAESGFEEEVRVLSRFRHPNLVTLLGFARSGQERMLVYEYLGGGDLYSRMAEATAADGGRPFPWRGRLSAARDAACGLAHLHGCQPRVFHRDIKSPNILLDQNGTAKMADFGLACLSLEPQRAVRDRSGTVGYACPVYSRTGVVTEASEVFSFGMVLLELLTGSPAAWAVSPPAPDGEQAYDFLLLHIGGDLGAALGLVDGGAGWPQATARALAELGLRCAGPPRRRGQSSLGGAARVAGAAGRCAGGAGGARWPATASPGAPAAARAGGGPRQPPRPLWPPGTAPGRQGRRGPALRAGAPADRGPRQPAGDVSGRRRRARVLAQGQRLRRSLRRNGRRARGRARASPGGGGRAEGTGQVLPGAGAGQGQRQRVLAEIAGGHHLRGAVKGAHGDRGLQPQPRRGARRRVREEPERHAPDPCEQERRGRGAGRRGAARGGRAAAAQARGLPPDRGVQGHRQEDAHPSVRGPEVGWAHQGVRPRLCSGGGRVSSGRQRARARRYRARAAPRSLRLVSAPHAAGPS
ncbi:unnamed protein product [Prorocentrum cordatum]|uniref:non-specific serine/threonine protein kinase n=2 Tax=Prorocentrum cordatum TaxID=2364126 RepID=A0ABN9SRD7_9DINO|nr:unnamed protein product [Polarella glacialis]